MRALQCAGHNGLRVPHFFTGLRFIIMVGSCDVFCILIFRTIYSAIGAALASYGFIVATVEHRYVSVYVNYKQTKKDNVKTMLTSLTKPVALLL